tara:strand:+ start:37 stop:639 length:603 start_codon:yes stop_codon:yes gene_type:complete
MSEKVIVKNIYQRIVAVMSEVSYVQKDDKKVAGQYRFVSHDSVAQAIHPQLAKHGIVIVPTVKSMVQDGNRTTMCLSVSFVNADQPDDRFTVESWGYGIDTGDKGPGKCYSYAYKYILLKTFCLETGEDPDQDQDVKYEPKTISQGQWEALLEYDTPEMKDFKNQVLKHYKIEDYPQLLESDFDLVYKRIVKVFTERNKK